MMTKPVIATTRTIVGTSNAKSPCSARRAASMAYATEETGSAMTAKANANSSAVRDRKTPPKPPRVDVRRRFFTVISGSRTDFIDLPTRLPGSPETNFTPTPTAAEVPRRLSGRTVYLRRGY